MNRILGVGGLIAIAFGAAAAYGGGELTPFSWINWIGGGVALAAAAVMSLTQLRGAGVPAFRGTLVRGVGRILLALFAAIGLERVAAASGVQFDWTFERRYELSEATTNALQSMCGELEADLFYDRFDPRIRSSRQLLRTLAKDGCLSFRERRLDEHPDEEDRFGIASSNTIVLRRNVPGQAERFELAERPSEGTVYEALFRLRDRHDTRILVARGAGEGNLELFSPTGYSGLAAALDTEGYEVHQFVSAAADAIPDDTDLLLWIAPERPLRPEALDALRAYLERGGRLVAFLEPGGASGLETVLAEWGLEASGIVVDPASGPVAGDAPGVNPLVYSYARTHPVARGLGSGRMTFFRGSCAFRLRKPQIEDKLNGIAFTSPRAWLSDDPGILDRRATPERPDGAREDYYPLTAAGAYTRNGATTRIVAFCDSELATNQNLRTLFNLDLVLNAVHWAAENEPDIALRAKVISVAAGEQFPIPVQNTLTMFQSLGLVIPEILLLIAATLWLRQRAS